MELKGGERESGHKLVTLPLPVHAKLAGSQAAKHPFFFPFCVLSKKKKNFILLTLAVKN